MGYLQALRMMVKAYKAAKGAMPKGLDLLKLKMKARQKAIDSKKVIEFPKERITNPFKPRPRSESEAQMLARMKRQNKEAAQRLRDKKAVEESLQKLKDSKKPQKTLKDLLDDYKGDPDAMADGGVASAIKKIKKRFGKKSITTGDKIKRPGNRQLFDDFKKRNKFIVGGSVRRNVTPQPRDPKLQNLINVYESNPTLQSSMSIDDYLMQAYRPTTPTTEELATGITTQATQPAAINPIKPIIPIPESDGDGDNRRPSGGITAGINFDYGYTGPSMTLADEGEGTILDEDYTLGMRARDALSGIKQTGQGIYSALSPIQMAKRAKDAFDDMRAKRAAEIIEQIRREEEARLQAQLNRPRPQTGGGTIDSGNTGGYGGTGGEGPSAVGSSGMLGGGV